MHVFLPACIAYRTKLMARSRNCPHCRQPMAHERCGVFFPPLKAAIFDTIKQAGDEGVTSAQIIRGPLYRDRVRVSESVIKSHVYQINEMLEDTSFIIVSDRRRWYLQRARA